MRHWGRKYAADAIRHASTASEPRYYHEIKEGRRLRSFGSADSTPWSVRLRAEEVQVLVFALRPDLRPAYAELGDKDTLACVDELVHSGGLAASDLRTLSV